MVEKSMEYYENIREVRKAQRLARGGTISGNASQTGGGLMES